MTCALVVAVTPPPLDRYMTVTTHILTVTTPDPLKHWIFWRSEVVLSVNLKITTDIGIFV